MLLPFAEEANPVIPPLPFRFDISPNALRLEVLVLFPFFVVDDDSGVFGNDPILFKLELIG